MDEWADASGQKPRLEECCNGRVNGDAWHVSASRAAGGRAEHPAGSAVQSSPPSVSVSVSVAAWADLACREASNCRSDPGRGLRLARLGPFQFGHCRHPAQPAQRVLSGPSMSPQGGASSGLSTVYAPIAGGSLASLAAAACMHALHCTARHGTAGCAALTLPRTHSRVKAPRLPTLLCSSSHLPRVECARTRHTPVCPHTLPYHPSSSTICSTISYATTLQVTSPLLTSSHDPVPGNMTATLTTLSSSFSKLTRWLTPTPPTSPPLLHYKLASDDAYGPDGAVRNYCPNCGVYWPNDEVSFPAVPLCRCGDTQCDGRGYCPAASSRRHDRPRMPRGDKP